MPVLGKPWDKGLTMPFATLLRRLLVTLPFLYIPPIQAELGDYSVWQALSNLVAPPAPDNPVTPAQRLGPYPMLANPAGFDSGFVPGHYYAWQRVQLAPQTGAVCGNGSRLKAAIARPALSSQAVRRRCMPDPR